jgi:hypothetical protein
MWALPNPGKHEVDVGHELKHSQITRCRGRGFLCGLFKEWKRAYTIIPFQF